MSKQINKISENSQARYQLRLFRRFWSVVSSYECFLEEVLDGSERDFILEQYCFALSALRRALLAEFERYYDEFMLYPALVNMRRRVVEYNPLKVRFARESRFYENRLRLGFTISLEHGELIPSFVKDALPGTHFIPRPCSLDKTPDNLPF